MFQNSKNPTFKIVTDLRRLFNIFAALIIITFLNLNLFVLHQKPGETILRTTKK